MLTPQDEGLIFLQAQTARDEWQPMPEASYIHAGAAQTLGTAPPGRVSFCASRLSWPRGFNSMLRGMLTKQPASTRPKALFVREARKVVEGQAEGVRRATSQARIAYTGQHVGANTSLPKSLKTGGDSQDVKPHLAPELSASDQIVQAER